MANGHEARAFQVFLKCLTAMMILAGVLAVFLAQSVAQAADINTVYVGLELRLNGTDIYANLLKTWPNQKINSSAPVASDAGISLSNDLHQRVQSGQLSPSDALQIESELMMRHGSVYYLPATQEELKEAVGFPRDENLSAKDLQDLIPVHAQMAMGVGVMASSYLIEKLKVKITVTEEEAMAQGIPLTPPAPAAPPSAPSTASGMAPAADAASVPATATVPPALSSPSTAPQNSAGPQETLSNPGPNSKPQHSDAPSLPAQDSPAGDSMAPIKANPSDANPAPTRVKAQNEADQTQS